jgi:hypothetical protein
MTYRNCIITPDPVKGLVYTWQHPDRVDYDPERGSVWSGYGSSVEECIAQIDEWYEDFNR